MWNLTTVFFALLDRKEFRNFLQKNIFSTEKLFLKTIVDEVTENEAFKLDGVFGSERENRNSYVDEIFFTGCPVGFNFTPEREFSLACRAPCLNDLQ